ncbi:hypothetical protein FGO68_gene6505 [Halteria grandinella]|uniref:Uncharacterized protein n=1 Tax=Halteria grandinella TaxID=5974 RepID=A0A8J8P2E4_HALGN|nr:hypothetical protein FGO68_gene6505 [Halteria grandinella]
MLMSQHHLILPYPQPTRLPSHPLCILQRGGDPCYPAKLPIVQEAQSINETEKLLMRLQTLHFVLIEHR